MLTNTLRKRAQTFALLALLLSAGPHARAQATEDHDARNIAAVQAAFDAWRAGTGSPFDLLAPDATWTIVGRSVASRAYASREAFMADVIRPFNARMQSPLKPTIRQILGSRGTVVVFFDATGMARDGQPYTNTYAWFLELRGGRIVKASAFFDSIAFNELWQRVQPATSKS
jgi:uncharacterized protein